MMRCAWLSAAACGIAFAWLVTSGRGLIHWALWSKESVGGSPALPTFLAVLGTAVLLGPLSLWCARKAWQQAPASGTARSLGQLVALAATVAFPGAVALLMIHGWLLFS